jgi:hypothetical protein
MNFKSSPNILPSSLRLFFFNTGFDASATMYYNGNAGLILSYRM